MHALPFSAGYCFSKCAHITQLATFRPYSDRHPITTCPTCFPSPFSGVVNKFPSKHNYSKASPAVVMRDIAAPCRRQRSESSCALPAIARGHSMRHLWLAFKVVGYMRSNEVLRSRQWTSQHSQKTKFQVSACSLLVSEPQNIETDNAIPQPNQYAFIAFTVFQVMGFRITSQTNDYNHAYSCLQPAAPGPTSCSRNHGIRCVLKLYFHATDTIRP